MHDNYYPYGNAKFNKCIDLCACFKHKIKNKKNPTFFHFCFPSLFWELKEKEFASSDICLSYTTR